MAVVDVEGSPVANESNFNTKLKKCCRSCLVFLVSQVGLAALVVGYALFGGLIFMNLESSREIKQKEIVRHIRSNYTDKLWEATKKYNTFRKAVWIEEAQMVFEMFQEEIYAAVKDKGWDGTDSEDDLQWTFAGALLYSITTITTIGYGHIAPKTPWGRIATIIYAIIGIPLTLLCLSNVGRFLGMCFRFLYGRIICGLCRRQRRRSGEKPVIVNEKTKGSGECPDGGEMGETGSSENKPDDGKELPAEEPIRVPVIIVLSVVVGYVLFGAFVFTLWENNWDFLVASYFCFVTLSTIGFGDFVPGTSLQSWSSQEKQILCSLYLVFGLSLLAMCFDLIQEQVRHTCRQIGSKMGCIPNKETKAED